MTTALRRTARRTGVFVFLLLAIEFFDELAFGLEQAALPLIRDSLNLDYVQIGLLFTIPMIFASFIEPVLGLFADGKHRRTMILTGGIGFIICLLLVASSNSFLMLMFAFCLFNPSSGAFVSISQAALMDIDPARHEQNMARWTLAGAIGVFAGPLLLGAVMGTTGNWRHAYLIVAAIGIVLWIAASRFSFAKSSAPEAPDDVAASLREVLRAVRDWSIMRWIVLLVFSDFMLDILNGFLALYFVDVVSTTEAEAGIAIAVWAGVGLIGDFLLIPLLERVNGLRYLRASAVLNLALYPAFLLVPGFIPKLIIVALLGFGNAGWYSVLQGRLYSSMPERSGLVITLGNVTALVESAIPLIIGLVAEAFGLGAGMWLLLLGPVVILIGLPRGGEQPNTSVE